METRNPEGAEVASALDTAADPVRDAQSLPVSPDQFANFDGVTGAYRGPAPATIDDPEREAVQSDDLARWAEAQGEARVPEPETRPVADFGDTAAYIEAHPITALALALGVGWVVARLTAGR